MTPSPYSGKPVFEWAKITRGLVAGHPLQLDVLREASLKAWTRLWKTRIGAGGTSTYLADLVVPATIVGYFFEVLLGTELQRRFPGFWRAGAYKSDKDLVYIANPRYSIEIKTSGQRGFKVFGNRSYGQKASNASQAKKEKSGFYLTMNFVGRSATLLRFGWIDADDWTPQASPTGQMAGLKQIVYDHKLLPVPGAYRRCVPMDLLQGVGPSIAEQFAGLGIATVGDLLDYDGILTDRLARIKVSNKHYLEGCYDKSPKS